MASDIEICNLALAHLGDTATVSSIDPPEGSAQAEHCARFYSAAMRAMLEMHAWSFATRQTSPALLVETIEPWAYVYALPTDAVRVISVGPASVTGLPIGFVLGSAADGSRVVCTDQAEASVCYVTANVTSQAFTPLFGIALSWLLSSMLAGPIIKGDQGAAEGKRCYQMFMTHLAEAVRADAMQRSVTTAHTPSWIAGR